VLCIVPMFFRFSPVGLCVVILLWVVGVVGWFNGIIRVSKLYVEESLVFGFVVWVCFCVFLDYIVRGFYVQAFRCFHLYFSLWYLYRLFSRGLMRALVPPHTKGIEQYCGIYHYEY